MQQRAERGAHAPMMCLLASSGEAFSHLEVRGGVSHEGHGDGR